MNDFCTKNQKFKGFLLCLIRSEVVVERCSGRKVILKIPQNSQENTCARVSFLVKLQVLCSTRHIELISISILNLSLCSISSWMFLQNIYWKNVGVNFRYKNYLTKYLTSFTDYPIYFLKTHSKVWDHFWQLRALEKWWKILFISAKKLFSFLGLFQNLWRHKLGNK